MAAAQSISCGSCMSLIWLSLGGNAKDEDLLWFRAAITLADFCLYRACDKLLSPCTG